MWSTTSAASRRARSNGNRLPLILLAAALLGLVAVGRADEDIHTLRAARRADVRAAVSAKAGEGPAPFGLLVIPVDFSDARFPDGYDPATALSARLDAPQTGSMADYFDVASRGRSSLEIRVAAVVPLPGRVVDYTDVGWQGRERTRGMVAAALDGAAAAGVDFSTADLDRDGEVDGILVVHAAPGLLENPDVLIEPQQYFLEDPVVQRGTVARSYAIVAAESPLGIWAHETAHLFGLEERYDVDMVGDTEIGPRGGLGAFSLMSAGWLGTGAGEDPSLLDAYSALQLGWADTGPLPAAGVAVRLDPSDAAAREYWLAESRDPAATAPYDAAVPASRLLVYHIDETLADDEASSLTWPGRHLRVHLVEADGGVEVARGESQGAVEDLFPVDGAAQDYDDGTLPSAHTWDGLASGIAVSVTVAGGDLTFTNRAPRVRADVRLTMVGQPPRPVVTARATGDGDLPESLAVIVSVESSEWGTFAGGPDLVVDVPRLASGSGWATHATEPLDPWNADGDPPSDAITAFSYDVSGGASGGGDLVWVWDATAAPIGIDGAWPNGWVEEIAAGGTRWHRWTEAGILGIGTEPVLACTGDAHVTAAGWPDVSYGNEAHAVVLSPPLGADVRWVELTQAVDVELLMPGTAIDGATATWVHEGGATVPAEPADGWPGRVDPRARHPLSGVPAFAVSDPLEGDVLPLWRREVLPLPDPDRFGPGPWRLRLSFASDSRWRARGWLVRRLAGHADPAPASGFPLHVEDGQLTWDWESSATTAFRLERSDDGGATWSIVDPFRTSTAIAVSSLGVPAGFRSLVRVIAAEDTGAAIVSRAVVIDGVDGASLGRPYPNPAPGIVWIDVDAAGDPRATLALHDLRGRLIRRWSPGAGPATVVWDGSDDDGRRAAAGVYILRLRTNQSTLTRKVTWLP